MLVINYEVNSEIWLDTNDLLGEEWRFVYETRRGRRYFVSNVGRIKLIKKQGKEIILKAYKNRSNGYYKVRIDGHQEYVHRIVATAFVKRTHSKYTSIDHRNGDKSDNSAINLRWVTQTINQNNPITKWERDKRHGKPCSRIIPNPPIGQDILTEKEGEKAIKLAVNKTKKRLSMNRLSKKLDI